MTSSDPPLPTPARPTPVQRAAFGVGLVFLLVAALGFVPGITTGYTSMSFASHHSDAMLFGIFQVSILHNLVHLLFGVVGIIAARAVRASSTYLVIGGAVYLLLFVYGLIVDSQSPANFVPVNPADDVLHVVLGIAMIGLTAALGRRSVERALNDAGD